MQRLAVLEQVPLDLFEANGFSRSSDTAYRRRAPPHRVGGAQARPSALLVRGIGAEAHPSMKIGGDLARLANETTARCRSSMRLFCRPTLY